MKTYIKYLRVPTDDDKLGPQEKACMSAVAKAAGDKAGERALRTDVIEALTAGGQLVTRQEPARILSFYQPKFVEKGLIEIQKEAEPKAEKPAKAPSEKKTAPGPAAGSPAKGTAPAPADGAGA